MMNRRLQIATAVFILSLCYALFFFKLGERDLWSSHEARAAQDAGSILQDGAWALPRLHDRRVDMQKPPLYYWMVAIAGSLRGTVDALAVRLPAALSALGCVILLYALGVKNGRAVAGLVAALILATSIHFTWLARTGRIDMPLTLCISIAIIGMYQGGCWLLPAYLSLAGALLLKGPIGLILPSAVLVAYWSYERLWGQTPPHSEVAPGSRIRENSGVLSRSPTELSRVRLQGTTVRGSLGLAWGVPLVIALVLPWYLWANVATGGKFLEVFIWQHNIERGLGTSETLATHPPWFYLVRLVIDLLPWSIVLPFGLWMHLCQGWWKADPEARLGVIWSGAILLVLTCSSFKRADYLLPAYPGIALALGCIGERLWHQAANRRRLVVGLASLLLACVAGWMSYVAILLPMQEAPLDQRCLAHEIRTRAPQPQLVIFFRTEAHALAYHVGTPIETLLEWENLDKWAAMPQSYLVVMPEEVAAEWRQHLPTGQLEEVLRNRDLMVTKPARPLILMRTVPPKSWSQYGVTCR